MPSEEDTQPVAEGAGDAGIAEGVAVVAEGSQDAKDPAPEETGEWYYQEPTTQQPAGPWTVAQLRTRWQRHQINGLTPVWRHGLQGWKPLAEMTELKDALREGEAEGEEERPSKRRRRTLIDEVPITHTYTSEQGLLYVYDTLDEDWKASDVYEALLRDEADAEKEEKATGCSEPSAGDKSAAGADEASGGMTAEEQEEALRELFAEAAKSGPGGAGPMAAVTDKKRRANLEEAKETAAAAAAAAAVPGQANGKLVEPLDPDKEAKSKKRREYRERKKLKAQAGLFIKAKENPNVYVSGLPPDVTMEELEPVFKRGGVLKVDVDTGGSKIRIYTGDDGKCKGDALITYANAASVELAVKFLHEHELRPDCRICVQQADFEDEKKDTKLSKDQLKELAAASKPDARRAKYLAAKNAQTEAVSWSGDMDDGSGRKIVVLKHMFSMEEAGSEGADFYKELAEEVKEECEKVGQVLRVTPLERHKQGIVCVKFKSSSEAEECIRVMDGRFFGGRTVEAAFHDKNTDLKALGMIEAKAPAPAKLHAAALASAVSDPASGVEGPADATAAGPAPEADAPAAQEADPGTMDDGKAAEDVAYNAMFDDQSSSDDELVVNTE